MKQRTIGALIEDKAETWGDKPFLIYKGQEFSYSKINEVSNRVANAMLDFGIKKGDHVAIMLPNRPEYICAWFGINKVGGVLVGISPRARGTILNHEVGLCDAEVIFLAQSLVPIVGEMQLSRFTKIIIVPDKQSEGGLEPRGEPKAPYIYWLDLLSYPSSSPEVDVQYYDPYGIVWTSGTTGLPKAALLPHNYAIDYCENMINHLRFTGNDVILNFYPLNGVAGQLEHVLPALMADAKLVLEESWFPEKFWDLVRNCKITYLFMYERVLPTLLRQPRKPNEHDNSLRVVIYGPYDPILAKEFAERFGVIVSTGGGMTEVGMTPMRPLDSPPEKLEKPGVMGPANCGREMRIVDDYDNELAPNQIGEIIYRPTKPFTTFLGYYKNPQAVVEMCRNLWVHSEDLGYKDEDGWFYFVGRKGDRLRSKGQMFSANMVEEIIDKHPKVAECAAVGVTNEFGEEDVMAFVVPAVSGKGSPLTCEELIDFCEKEMTYYMVPRYIELRESLPKTENQKIKKKELKERGVTDKTWDRKGYIKRL